MKERIGKKKDLRKRKIFDYCSGKKKSFLKFKKEFKIIYWVNGNSIRGNLLV